MEKLEEIEFIQTYKAGKILEKCNNSFLEQIKFYDLSYCKLSKKCIEILEKMKNLERFHCFRLTLASELMEIINNSIKNNLINLREISLFHTSLTSKSLEELIDIIQNLKQLVSFSINENDIGTNSIIQIVKTLRDNCHDLTRLDISKTLEYHNVGLDELWDALTNINNLSRFVCQDNYMNL